MSRPWSVRDVEALDPDRQALEVERLAQLLERLDPPQPLLLGLEPRPTRARARAFSAASSCSRRFSPRSGARTSTARAAQLGEERRRAPSVSPASGGHDQLRRHARRRAVVLEAERLEHRRRRPARRRSRGGTRSGRSAGRRAAGRPAPRPGRRRPRAPITSIVADRAPVGRLPLGEAARPRAAGCGSAPRPRTAPPPPPRASAASSSRTDRPRRRRRGTRSRRRSRSR